MSTKYYDADQVTVSIAGIPLSGYAEGEFLRIEQETDDFDDVAGTDGEVTRSKTNDARANVTVLLMQSSDSNDLLSALSNTDRRAPNGAGVGAFLVRDRNGRALYTAPACWVKRPPNATFDRTATAREWLIRVANLERFDGGN
jgi:hypothetical protein